MKSTNYNSTVVGPAARPGAIALGADSSALQAFQSLHGFFVPAIAHIDNIILTHGHGTEGKHHDHT